MPYLGVHFALTNDEVEILRSLQDEQQRLDYVLEVLEGLYFDHHREYLAQSDKAWDAMHRVLANGQLTWEGGDYPLNHVVLAGELLYTESDYILSLKSPEQVRDIASALSEVTEESFRARYFQLDPENYGLPLTEDDLSYTWQWFQEVRRLYQKAASEGRYVLFTADQ